MRSPRYDPLPRSSSSFEDNGDDNEFKLQPPPRRLRSSLRSLLLRKARRFCRPIYLLLLLVLLLCAQVTFNASYIHPPSFTPSTTETVFIAANILDGKLVAGAWGKSLLSLIDIIGKDRVYVSIYGGPEEALQNLSAILPCPHSVVFEKKDPVNMAALPRVNLPSGETRVKRIEYLAEVRNHALKPLHDGKLDKVYDRVLFLNDIYFKPWDAARLLWGTNVNAEGVAEYKAVCGTDFIESWKFYDTYATRDMEGYSMGVPIYPWFANVGEALSRKDVRMGKDNVRVSSCWGGMVAFDGRYFRKAKTEPKPASNSTSLSAAPILPLRFRSEQEIYWDSSECCLINADLLAIPEFPVSSAIRDSPEWGTGIFMNPYVRVAYDANTFRHIKYAQRFERLFTPWSSIINYFAKMPHHNPRRLEQAGKMYHDKKWVSFSSEDGAKTKIALGDEDSTWQGSDVSKRSLEDAERTMAGWDAEYDGQSGGGSIGDEDASWQGWDSAAKVETGRQSAKQRQNPVFTTNSHTILKRTQGAALPVNRREIQSKAFWLAEGEYREYEREATRGGYCGVRQLTIVKDWKLAEGEKNWENLRGEVPPLDLS